MARYRFSIRGLMIVIVVLALAFTALRTPSRLWANAWFTLALGGVTIAIPAAVANVGDRRAFWVGFAVCGWVYFFFSLRPGSTRRPATSSSPRRSWTSPRRTSSIISTCRQPT